MKTKAPFEGTSPLEDILTALEASPHVNPDGLRAARKKLAKLAKSKGGEKEPAKAKSKSKKGKTPAPAAPTA